MKVDMDYGNAARIADNIRQASLEPVFDAKTGRYYAPYSPAGEEHVEAIEQIGQEYAQSKGYSGERDPIEDRPIAVLDTGVLSHHPGLKDRLVGSVDFTGEGPDDLNGHGTVVALLAAGPDTPGPSILNVKVLNRDGLGSEENIAAGMRWAAENGAGVISMSLGVPRRCDGTCPLCSEATKLWEEYEVLICAAAGNWGPDVPCCPAQCDVVVATGALDETGSFVEDYSGPGDHYGPATVGFVPVEDDGTWRTDLYS